MNRLKLSWMAWVAALLMTSLSGCATYMASQSTETTTKITKTLAYEDAILGMGQPTGENISAEARNFLALIGEKQTYLLTEGADEIKAIVKNLDGRLIGVNQDQPKINMLVQQDSSEIQSVRGDVTITYADSTGLERDYGFKPSIGIREGLRRFAEWYAGYYLGR